MTAPQRNRAKRWADTEWRGWAIFHPGAGLMMPVYATRRRAIEAYVAEFRGRHSWGQLRKRFGISVRKVGVRLG